MCLCGTRNGDLLRFLERYGQTLETFPVNYYITVGGAVATASHGASLNVGTISQLVRGGTYLKYGDFSLRKTSRKDLPFWSCSIGRLGMLCAIRLETRPLPGMIRDTYEMTRRSFLDTLADTVSSVHRLVVEWNPDTDVCTVERYVEETPSVGSDISTDRDQNRGSLLDFFLGPEGSTPESPPSLSYVEAGYAVPIDRLSETLEIVHSWKRKNDIRLIGPVYLRFVGRDVSPLGSPGERSSSYPRVRVGGPRFEIRLWRFLVPVGGYPVEKGRCHTTHGKVQYDRR